MLLVNTISLPNSNIKRNNAPICGFTFPSSVSSKTTINPSLLSPPPTPNDSSSISRNDSVTTYYDESDSLSIGYSSDSQCSNIGFQSHIPYCSSVGYTTDNTSPSIRQDYEAFNTIQSGAPLDNEDNANDTPTFEPKQNGPIIPINSPCGNYFTHSITTSQLSILLNEGRQINHFWKLIDKKKYPNLLNHEFLATLKGQYLFEIALSQIGLYDSRFFGSDESLWLYRQVVFGPSNFRKAAAKTLYNRLLEKQVQEEEKELEINNKRKENYPCIGGIKNYKNGGYNEGKKDEYYDYMTKEKTEERREQDDEEELEIRSIATAISAECISKLQWEVPLIQIADVIVQIFGDYMLNLFLQDSGCFLAEHLWKICSDDMKLYLCELLIIRNCNLLVTDPKGNYIISIIIEWLYHQLNVKSKNYNALLFCWQWIVNWIAGDLTTFVKLCKDHYGVYVVKNFVKYCGIDIQVYLLNELTRHALIPHLKEHPQAKYVVKNLAFFCCRHNQQIQ